MLSKRARSTEELGQFLSENRETLDANTFARGVRVLVRSLGSSFCCIPAEYALLKLGSSSLPYLSKGVGSDDFSVRENSLFMLNKIITNSTAGDRPILVSVRLRLLGTLDFYTGTGERASNHSIEIEKIRKIIKIIEERLYHSSEA
ncbi:MAG: hypothetical protein WCT31_01075 [Candidatus Micrarchaeia archaeon]